MAAQARDMRRGVSIFILVLVFALTLGADLATAQGIMRPGQGANQSGVTIVLPTFTPPYRLTITVYVTAQDGRRLPPPLGANLLVIDGQGRREGMDADGVLRHEIPNARWEPFVVNPAPQAPVGPRGQMGTAGPPPAPRAGRPPVGRHRTRRLRFIPAPAPH